MPSIYYILINHIQLFQIRRTPPEEKLRRKNEILEQIKREAEVRTKNFYNFVTYYHTYEFLSD